MTFEARNKQSLLNMVRKLKTLKIPVREGMTNCALSWVDAIKDGMENTKKRSDGRSEPGNFPAVQTGMLQSSFEYKLEGWSSIEVGTNVPYAIYLEHGTSKMLPRPIIAEQFDLLKLRDQFRSLITDEIVKYLK